MRHFSTPENVTSRIVFLWGYVFAPAFSPLSLYRVFFLPGVVALAGAGYSLAADSWAINGHASIPADGPPIYPFKTIIPMAGALLLLQGLVEILRCIVCLRDGEWPSREQDVEEVDVDKLKAMVHVKDEDIYGLDKYVAPPDRLAKGGTP